MKRFLTAALALGALALTQAPASALTGGSLAGSAIERQGGLIERTQGRQQMRAAPRAVGPRMAAPRAVTRPGPGVVRPGIARPGIARPGIARPGMGVRPAPGMVRPGVRPGRYVNRPYRTRYWRPGVGWAIGPVIAIGALSAAAAAAYAPPPPYPGACWYYTDPSYTTGYWAECPY